MKTAKLQRDICRNINAILESEMKNDDELIDYLDILIDHSIKNNSLLAPKKEVGDKVSLLCIQEAKSKYNANDSHLNENSTIKGQSLYSPRIDICISPVIINKKTKQCEFIFNKLILDTRDGFYNYVMNQYHGIEQFILKIQDEAFNNFKTSGCSCSQIFNPTINPLHLLGIELEMNPDLKHLFGDFVNAYILSKHPVVVIKDEIFDKAMNMLQYLKVTNELKNHQLDQLLCVSPLKLSQFIQIVNISTEPYDVEPINLNEY